mmetsp:Transcript_73347/g.207856  ORF Transcript_73347/g.207856 Transcript_73347/m.207856 type:complete len:383 (-) Transcript_73347:115-1263(-)
MPAPANGPLALGTDCSGMETPAMALQNLGIEVDHVFSCDVNKHVKATIMANFPPKVWYDDLTARDNARAKKADLYVAGFPCQPFSTAGLQQGFQDKRGRGEIFFHVRDYIEKQAPRVFVLENVSGLVKINGGEYYRAINKALDDLGTYNVYSKVLDTKEHGIPQSRRRVYWVGIKKSCDDGSFTFPEPVPLPSIELFLEPRKRRPSWRDLPPASQGTALGNVRKAVKELFDQGHDPLREAWIVDCDSSENRMKYVKGVTPCMTCSRGAGHWVTNRGRRMTKTEMMRMQGMRPETFKLAVSETQLGKQIGNAMSCNVLERLFARALPAARLIEHGAVVDRWAAGKPPACLTTARKARLTTLSKKRTISRGAAARVGKRLKAQP